MSLDTLQTINFAGKDGFQWFFAKVVPQEYWKGTADALNLDGKQSHRAKIRICGYDTFEESELPDEDCRWAQFLPSANVGDGTGGLGETLCLAGGESVLGFFADGPDGQVPMIFSVLPKAQAQVENKRKRNSDPDLSVENSFSLDFDTSLLGSHQYSKEWMEINKGFPTSTFVYKGGQNLSSMLLEDNATIKISSINICGDDVVSQAREAISDWLEKTQKLNNNFENYNPNKKTPLSKKPNKNFSVPVKISSTEDIDNKKNLITIETSDSPDLLVKIAEIFYKNGTSIYSARINTLGNKVEDTFEIEDMTLSTISAAKIKKITTAIEKII